MRVIDHGALAGYISLNLHWAGFEPEDYFRASQAAMGLLDEGLVPDLEKEYLPEAGRRLAGLVDDHGISKIARENLAAEGYVSLLDDTDIPDGEPDVRWSGEKWVREGLNSTFS